MDNSNTNKPLLAKDLAALLMRFPDAEVKLRVDVPLGDDLPNFETEERTITSADIRFKIGETFIDTTL